MYSDLLDNLKVEKLSDKQYRRWSKLLALANVNIPRGRLPPVDKIAFRLRVNEAAATLTVQEFIDLKFIDVIRGAWVMHDWDDWQKDSDARTTEGRSIRGASAADTRRNEQPIANDKPLMRRLEGEGEGEGDKEREEEEEKDHGTVPVVRAFERCFGRLLSPMEIENIKALDEEHPRDRIDYALRETAALGKRSVRYVQRVCETQAQAGDNRDATKPVGRNAAPTHPPLDSAAALAAAYPGIKYWPEHLGPDGGGADAGLAPVDGGNDPPRLEVRR